ncbi:MAG: LytTR family DNA-binding domain-containing protein [Bacteroidales bacterium]|nr:LytTR family DNA-binding domain-containing protein [Bacteroidales bacterium]
MYKVLIVDDEFLARKLLQGYLDKMPDVEVVGSCANAFEAFKAIKEHQVDILLLDINMPDLNGLDFARTCHDVPAIIFTTAYSEYALESYEVSAVDYLLKPIALTRFAEAMQKARNKVSALRAVAPATPAPQQEQPVPAEPASTDSAPSKDYMLVKADYKLYKINYDDLLYIEGQHEYVSFYTKEKRITALYALKTLEETLPADRFLRVHKSYIVAINQIREIEPLSLTVANVKIPIGGIYRETLMKRLSD